MKKLIEGCGFSCIDMIQDDETIISDVGGTCANVLSILGFMGWNSVLWIPAYEEDKLSTWLKERRVVCVYFANSKKRVPEIYQKYSKDRMDHFFFTRCPYCGVRFADSDLPNRKQTEKKEISYADVFFCDRISEGIMDLAQRTKESGGLTMYESNGLRFYNQFMKACKQFDIVKYSEERIPSDWKERILKDLVDSQVQLVIMTMGKNGLRFAYRDGEGTFSEWKHLDSYEVEEGLDSSGAGDWLTAAFLYYFIPKVKSKEKAFEYEVLNECLMIAMKIAAFSCNEKGAQGILHNEQKIRELEILTSMKLGTAIPRRREQKQFSCPSCEKGFI